MPDSLGTAKPIFRFEAVSAGDLYRVKVYARVPDGAAAGSSTGSRWLKAGVLMMPRASWESLQMMAIAGEELGVGTEVMDEGEIKAEESEWGRTRRLVREEMERKAKDSGLDRG